MRIVLLEIENFRGIETLRWAPAPGVNCLIGPGDSTKTTVLDAIELCLNPRSYVLLDDCDFYNLDIRKSIRITVTLADLPPDFRSEDRYGLHLRGWDSQKKKIEDEPRDGLEDALSVSVVVDHSLEARWAIFNERVDDERDPPTVRYKDAKQLATTRLGPYADRHLGWGRSSVLARIGGAVDGLSLQLAEASRAARQAFRNRGQTVFSEAIEWAQKLSKKFAVPVRGTYTAELDVQGVNITSGGIALHDESLPLRRLGAGSSRLIVAALQHEAGPPHIALIDEIEHGLEPHRIARLLRHLKTPKDAVQPQVFLTTHSPVVIRELTAADIFAVRSVNGATIARSVSSTAKDLDTAQRHLRGTPEAFLARKILVCEGRTEQGLARGLDEWWYGRNKDSFALQGVVAIDGGGKDKAPQIAEHLLDLGYGVFLLLDSDKQPDDSTALERIADKGGTSEQWASTCSTEERIFLDLPWNGVREVVQLAQERFGDASILDRINNALAAAKSDGKIGDLDLAADQDTHELRCAFGQAAKKGEWYKDLGSGERLAAIIGPYLEKIEDKPLTQSLARIRNWIDG